jgi:hypothetical protein
LGLFLFFKVYSASLHLSAIALFQVSGFKFQVLKYTKNLDVEFENLKIWS